MKVSTGSWTSGVLVGKPVPPALASILPVLIGMTGPPQERTEAYTPIEKRSAIEDLVVMYGAMLLIVSLKPCPRFLVGGVSSKMSDASIPPVPTCTQAVAISWNAVRSHSAELARLGRPVVENSQGWTKATKPLLL